jgi:hypothetical protein
LLIYQSLATFVARLSEYLYLFFWVRRRVLRSWQHTALQLLVARQNAQLAATLAAQLPAQFAEGFRSNLRSVHR